MITFIKENTRLLYVESESPLYKKYECQSIWLSSVVSGAGVIGGAVSLVASAFFGYDCLYPATITGFSFFAWAGAGLGRAAAVERLKQKIEWKQQNPKWKKIKEWEPVCLMLPDRPEKETFIRISAFTNGTDLKYKTLNLKTDVKISGFIQFNRPINETMESLKKSFATLEDDGTPVFSPSYHTMRGVDEKKGVFGKLYRLLSGVYQKEDVHIELLLRKNDLIWNVYYEESQRVIATQKNCLSKNCAGVTREIFNRGKFDSLVTRINLARELMIYKCSSREIQLEPCQAKSCFNPEILVSKFMWAITLIRYEGTSGNHAEIIVEGMNTGIVSEKEIPVGKYFVCIAHLRGLKEVVQDGKICEVRDIEQKFYPTLKVKYEARSQTWKRPSSRVEGMLLDINKECKDPPPGFAQYGRHSVLASLKSIVSKDVVEDSCITWAINKLESIGVILEETTCYHLFTDTSVYASLKPDEQERKIASDAKLI